MNDRIEKINHSKIQHGKQNDRIYLMKLAPEDFPEIIPILNQFAKENDYSKIFAKIPSCYTDKFLDDGYNIEALVPNLYLGRENGLFLGKYFNPDRQKIPQKELHEFEQMIKKIPPQIEISYDSRFLFRKSTSKDAEKMSQTYRQIFQSYPFPIFEADYLRQTLDDGSVYFGAWEDEQLIALASAEMDLEFSNVEMTDFAVLPKYRGNQLALCLLKQMEVDMKFRGIKTSYTIARLKSPGMNITFLKSGYQYTGTLINNTNICGNLESMNVWFKTL